MSASRDENEQRFTACFHPEAWQHDEAVPVDPPRGEPQTWDCTAYAIQHLDYLASLDSTAMDSLTGKFSVIDREDRFQADPAAPRWVREWRGPCTIRVRKEA